MNIGRRAYGETDSANNTQTYYHTDALGSVLATSKANKSIAARYDYDAWGKELNNTDTSDNPLGYTGHQMDRESENKTGLIYANARYLDPDTGRFLSFDPFEGYDDKPISLHRYMYAYQNPVRYTDPDGEVAVLAAVGAYLAYTAVMSVFDTASEAAIDATVSHVTGNESNFDAVSSFGENMLINAATFGAAGKVKTTARIAEAADTINDARKAKSATKTTKESSTSVNSKVEGSDEVSKKQKLETAVRDKYKESKKKTGDGTVDRDHIPSTAAMLKRAEEIKGGPLSKKESAKIKKDADIITMPKDMHKAGDTHGYKNTPELIKSDASDLAKAAKRDTDTHLNNAPKYDPNKVKKYEAGFEKIRQRTNEDYDKFLSNRLNDK